jgi:tRNA modification GTPase
LAADPTIFAVSSGAGPAGVAVIRLSGAGAGDAVRALAGDLPAPRQAAYRALHRPSDGELLDRGLVLWFPGPHSFTGENAAELQVHGGRAVMAAVLDALGGLPKCRPAAAGEFARRAFANGKLDLTAVEGLADLIAAETEGQRRQALCQAEGALGAVYEDWRARLVAAQAFLEADIEFPDEELSAGERRELTTDAGQAARLLGQEVAAHLADRRRGERLRDGVSIALLGAPNVGKSSLLNLLARRDAAIVSASAGTTRDVIEVHLDLGGYPVILADTAGLRAMPGDEIEREGVTRAHRSAAAADLKVIVCDAETWPNVNNQTISIMGQNSFVVVNKLDLRPDLAPSPDDLPFASGAPPLTHKIWPVSAKTGQGLDSLLAALELAVAEQLSPGTGPSLTRARHRAALEICVKHLSRFEIETETGFQASELAAEDLRLAARALGRITGGVDVEDLLDVIFADFCIGK